MHSLHSLRLVVMFVAVVLFGVAFMAPAYRASADANAPRWTSGDYWVYADTANPNNTLRVEVVGQENAQTLLGTTYSTFHIRETSTTGSVGITTDTWVRVQDLGIVRSSVTLFNVVTITTFDPPQTQASFPLFSLKAWNVALNVSIKIGNNNPTTFAVTVREQVDGEVDVTVPAGRFHCFSIRTLGAGAYTKFYYSDQAGYWSKRENYNANDQKTSEMALTSYRYQWNTWYLAIIGAVIGVVALLVVAFLWKRRKQSMGLPGGPQPSYPRNQPPPKAP